MGRNDPSPSLRYDGWTMVDFGRSKFASNDRTHEMIRLCRDNEPMATALRLFHEVVDQRKAEDD